MVLRSSGIGAKHGLYRKKIMRKLGFLMVSVKISHAGCHQVFWPPANGLTMIDPSRRIPEEWQPVVAR
jgi:hypothetical protein